MLFEILKHIRNFFPDLRNQRTGHFEVREGAVDPFPTLYDGQYFLIEGSALNDGVWKNGETSELKDESFDGAITPLKIPREFLDLVKEIEEFQAKDQPSAYTSESFAGYSRSRGTSSSGAYSWQNVFGSRLKSWRKI